MSEGIDVSKMSCLFGDEEFGKCIGFDCADYKRIRGNLKEANLPSNYGDVKDVCEWWKEKK